MDPVYYAFMGLGTEETIVSIALVSIPPGNIAREIADVRRKLWALANATSARAWFDFPVYAWLGSPLEGSILAGMASRCTLPFKLEPMIEHKGSYYLPFSTVLAQWAREVSERIHIADATTGYKPGPFPSGIGCYCATVPEDSDFQLFSNPSSSMLPMNSRTHLLAQVEFSWKPGPNMESSWATLSAARFGKPARTA